MKIGLLVTGAWDTPPPHHHQIKFFFQFSIQFFADAIAFTSTFKNSPCSRKDIIINEIICRLECFYRQKMSVDLRIFFNSKEFWSKGGWGCLSQMSVLLY